VAMDHPRHVDQGPAHRGARLRLLYVPGWQDHQERLLLEDQRAMNAKVRIGPSRARGETWHKSRFLELSRPLGAVIPKRNGGPRPRRRGLGQLHGWFEMAQPPGWRLADHRPAFQLAGGELGGYTLQRRSGDFAEIDDPLADLSERDPDQP